MSATLNAGSFRSDDTLYAASRTLKSYLRSILMQKWDPTDPKVRLGHKQTKRYYGAMSTLAPKADIERHDCHARFVPCVDGSELARLFFTFAGWSVQPCVRPICAVHMTAGHNALRGSGPGQKPAFEMHWHKWVVLIAGSTGSALRAVGPPNLHITPDVGAIGHAASATGSL